MENTSVCRFSNKYFSILFYFILYYVPSETHYTIPRSSLAKLLCESLYLKTTIILFFSANAYLDKLEQLQIDASGQVDVSGTWDFMKELKTLSGRNLADCELECCMKAQAGEERCIDRRKFIELISRIKLTRN